MENLTGLKYPGHSSQNHFTGITHENDWIVNNPLNDFIWEIGYSNVWAYGKNAHAKLTGHVYSPTVPNLNVYITDNNEISWTFSQVFP